MWAHEHFGIKPDVLAFGKKTQVCGCMVGPKVDEEPENVFKVPSRINSTWGGNLTDMVRFGRYLEIIEEERLVDNARVVGDAPAARPGGRAGASWAALMTQRPRARPDDRLRPARRPSCATGRTSGSSSDGLLLLTCGAAVDPLPPAAQPDRGRGRHRPGPAAREL